MMADNRGADEERETAFVIHPDVQNFKNGDRRSVDAMVEEICSLTKAIELDIVGVETFKVARVQAGSFLGKGQREIVAQICEDLKPNIVIVNFTLSPVQQRNLEKSFGAKVIDRTGLILEIFGARAQTKEGRLQVDLASLNYQRSRLVRSWTHLERQRGGAGFMGGPGERQIEIDRRLIDNRITKLKKELETVKRTRELGRKARERVPYPVVALVGYTNAGKSTLFNTLTKSDVFAQDLLFATLDPTLRQLELPNGQKVILSDTVGFISDLPTHLIAAFRATLEETLHADVILHVCDIANPDFKAQHDDVVDILTSLDIEYETDPRIIEVYNKIDNLDIEDQADLRRRGKFDERIEAVSAINGEGLDSLLETVTRLISSSHNEVSFLLSYADGGALSWLYDNGEVLGREDVDGQLKVEVRLSPEDLSRFTDRYPYKPINSFN
tara:strand:+ start:8286 stop:9611 length:1326 start_codon:yes stop_codon:yes gene_type:complete